MDDIDIQAGGTVAIVDHPQPIIDAERRGIAFTLGAMGSPRTNFYNNAYKRGGYLETARVVQKLWSERRRDEAIAEVPDEMVLQSNLIGDKSAVKQRIQTYRDAGVTTLRVSPYGSTLDERIETLAQTIDLVGEVSNS